MPGKQGESMAQPREYWQQRATAIQIEGRAFIDGSYVRAQDGQTFDCINPATGKILTKITCCGEGEVERAVAAARKAFDHGDWSHLAPRQRAQILKRFAALIREHSEELALLETLDVGKPISDTTAVDIPGAAYCVEWFAETIDKVGGEVARLTPAW
jgi:gamma-glutamyl-gamma-aminobutyraldehyde dehydrogenase